ncbi:hypothetical protein ALC62_10342 [Cyphomyrmex costatus]|uniref:Uncharacterized protein n=1 Tax=Cyphomyrmex costatus TaxID=456900 RepID=A0A151IE14_9HYME|nr:hypothetical protein ALC62_10342 [Cyphomyrmex costatus]
MTQVSSCGTAQCAIIKGVLFCLMDLVEPQSAATSRVDRELKRGNAYKFRRLYGAKGENPQDHPVYICVWRLNTPRWGASGSGRNWRFDSADLAKAPFNNPDRENERGKGGKIGGGSEYMETRETRCHRKDESRSEIIPAPDAVDPDKMDDVREKNFIDNTLFSELIRIYLQQSCVASGSMNGGSNTKVTKSKSVHYAFSTILTACSLFLSAHQYQPVITLAREHNEIVAERVESGMSARSRWPAERVRCWLRGPKISNPLGIRKLMKHST